MHLPLGFLMVIVFEGLVFLVNNNNIIIESTCVKKAKTSKIFQVSMKDVRSNHFAKATSTIYELSTI
jgi:hypothetical protein